MYAPTKLLTELSSERVFQALEAALGALCILIAQNMSKRAYLEEVIARIQLAKFQLQHYLSGLRSSLPVRVLKHDFR